MLKNITTFAILLCAIVHAASSTDNFNPENSEFSKRDTLVTWVDPKYHKDLKTLQRNVAMTVRENPFSMHFFRAVPTNTGQKRDYGKTFPTISAIELPFLQYVRSLSNAGISPISLEVAGGIGLVTWKIPFATGGKGRHVVNELSAGAITILNTVLSKRIEDKELAQIVEIDQGDCFSILSRRPDLRGKVHALFVQNLEHFFNPAQHQMFLNLLNELLAEDGQAFLCSHSFTFGMDGSNPLYKLHKARKAEKDIYSGFYQCKVTFMQFKDSAMQLGEFTMTDAVRPSDDAEITKKDISHKAVGKAILPTTGIPTDILEVTQEAGCNSFSPSIYRAAVGQIPTLEVLDSFFIYENGRNAGTKWGPNISHAAAIIKKKTEPLVSADTNSKATLKSSSNTNTDSKNNSEADQ